MEQNINELISEIEKKAKSFHFQMRNVFAEKDVLEKENDSLKKHLAQEKAKNNLLESNISELKNTLNSMNENAVISSKSDGPTKDEMDELIKEIDFCIAQIKK